MEDHPVNEPSVIIRSGSQSIRLFIFPYGGMPVTLSGRENGIGLRVERP